MGDSLAETEQHVHMHMAENSGETIAVVGSQLMR
jgi:hypothetical protein